MELNIQYLNDKNGKVRAVKIPIRDWEELQSRLRMLSRDISIKNDLKQALFEVTQMQEGKFVKQSLDEFLTGL